MFRPQRTFDPSLAKEMRAWAEDGLIASVRNDSLVQEVAAEILSVIREHIKLEKTHLAAALSACCNARIVTEAPGSGDLTVICEACKRRA